MSAEPTVGPDTRGLWQRLEGALASRYALKDVLGSGGSGTVFAAHDLKHDRRVALKVLRPALSASVPSERFIREIRIAARLTHPHIVPLHDSGEADGLLYYVMPLMEGESLRSLLEREDQVPVARAVSIAREIADALGHAHDLGIVHRDVKPGNILLSGGHALLSDFGVARATEAATGDMTVAGVLVGTPYYMSPEQLSEEGVVGPQSDLYALGCVLYEMLTGRPPFQGNSARAVLASHIRGQPTPVASLRPDVPPGLVAAIDKALKEDIDERFDNAADFADALTATAAIRGPPRITRMGAGIATGVIVTTAVVLWSALAPGSGPTVREGSVVVLPFSDAIQSPEEDSLVVDLAGELTRQLNRWDSVQAVPQVSLTGVAFDLGVDGPVLHALVDGRRLAEALSVETLITLNVRVRGDSAEVTATRFDPRSQRPRGPPLESRGPKTDPSRLAAAIAHGLLGLPGPAEAVESLWRRSSNAEALRYFESGLDRLERWRLQEAESSFRAATELDSAFAMAHHYLAVDLYWQAAREPSGLLRLGPEAARLSRAALRHAEELPSRDRDHIFAFHRFLEGDYQQARDTYASLIARDPTDVYAWLLQGIVEFTDPWLVEQTDGTPRPRADWNTAVRSFTETTRLNPDFHLGYGHLFDITDEVLATAYGGGGGGKYLPGTDPVAPWEPDEPYSMEAFYVAFRDSITWLSEAEFEATPTRELEEGAARLLEQSLRTLRRWATYAPNEPRPHAELAQWTIRQRSLLPAPQPPAKLDSLAREARDQAEQALSLTTDTVPADLVRLGNLYLATHEHLKAYQLVESAIDRQATDDGPLPPSSSNVFVHGGAWKTALENLEHESFGRRYLVDPATGELGKDGGAEPVIRRLAILGAAGVTGEPLALAFEQLEALWADPPDGTAPLSALRRHAAPRIATALAAAPEALARWRSEAGLADPLWEVFDSTSAHDGSALRAALATRDPEVRDPARSYLLGVAALRNGQPTLALKLLGRLDSIPLGVTVRDPGWGLRSLALFHRGETYEALGDPAQAAALYLRFLETRTPGDDTAPFQAAALDRLARLQESGSTQGVVDDVPRSPTP